MPTAALDLLDIDPFDLVEDEEPFTPVQKVDAAASVAELLERALRVIAEFEETSRRRAHRPRRARKARVTAHLPGEHRQQDHAGGLSSPNAIKGVSVIDADGYADSYGDVWDDAGIDLGLDGEERGLTARFFERGDLHVVLDLEDGKRQVLEDMDPEGMRQLAYDLEEVLAVDETEFEGGDPYGIVADADSDKHGFYVAKDGVGDIRIQPPDAEDDDYLELSEEQARDFVDKLLNIADSYEEHFAGGDGVEVVAGGGRPSQTAVVAHGDHDQSTHGREKSLKVDVPKPARRKAEPKAKPEAKVAAPKAPARKRATGVRDSLANAADIGELSTAAQLEARRITGRDIGFDFTGTDLEVGREHGEGILKGLERFPGARLGFVGTYGPGSKQTDTTRDLQVTQADSAAVTRSHGISENGKFVLVGNVYFNNTYAGDPDKYRETFEPEAGGGPRHVVTSGARGVALHEFGHVVAATDGAMAREAYGDAVTHAEGLRRDPRSLIAREVSAYASTSPGEFAAEAFADVMENGDAASELSRAAFALMQTRYAEAVS